MHQNCLVRTFWTDFLAFFADFLASRWSLRFYSSFFLRNFSSSIFRRSASISPTIRCSAGALDGNEVHFRTETLADRTGCKFIIMLLTVFWFLVTVVTLCTIHEAFCTFLAIFCDIEDFKLSLRTAISLFPAKLRRSSIIALSSLVNMTFQGLSIFYSQILLFSQRNLLILESVDLRCHTRKAFLPWGYEELYFAFWHFLDTFAVRSFGYWSVYAWTAAY